MRLPPRLGLLAGDEVDGGISHALENRGRGGTGVVPQVHGTAEWGAWLVRV